MQVNWINWDPEQTPVVALSVTYYFSNYPCLYGVISTEQLVGSVYNTKKNTRINSHNYHGVRAVVTNIVK